MRMTGGLLAAAVLACSALPGAGRAALIHSYDFTADLSDTVPSGAPLVSSYGPGGSAAVGDGGYRFTPNGGLLLDSQLPGSIYTIEIATSLSRVSGYNKLITFNDLSDDRGFYVFNGNLSLYNYTGGSNNGITVDTPYVFRLSRDASNLVTGYFNDTLAFSYEDTSGAFVASSALYFLRDDTRQTSEASGGFADYIRIYDTAVPLDTPAVPEPASWAMMVLGFGLVGGMVRRKIRISNLRFESEIKGIAATAA